MKTVNRNKTDTDRKNQRKVIVYGVSLFCMIAVIFLFFVYRVKPASEAESAYQPEYRQDEQMASPLLLKGNVIEQTYEGTRDEISSFGVIFGTYGRTNNCHVYVDFLENEEVIQSYDLEASALQDCAMQKFPLEKTIIDGKGKIYRIRITSDAEAEDNAVSVITTTNDFFSGGKCYWNGEEETKDIYFEINGTTNYLKTVYMLFAFFMVAGAIALALLCFSKRYVRTEHIFLVLGITMGLFFTIFFPPYSAPDEQRHIATAYANAGRILGWDTLDEDGTIYVRKTDADVGFRTNVSKFTYNCLYDDLHRPVEMDLVKYDHAPLGVPITSHLPQTLGVMVGWLFGLSGIYTLYLGKLFALIFYLTMVYLGIRFMPWGKMVLAVIALLPISLELAGSFSYDSVLNALSFFFIGYIMYLIYEKKSINWKNILGLVIISAIMAPTKIVYIFLCGIVFLIPKDKYKNKNIYWISSVLVPAAGGFIIAVSRLDFFVNMIFGTHEVSGASSEAAGFSLMSILSEPVHSLGMVFNTYFRQGSYYLQTLMGGSLGWLQVEISWVVVTGLVVILGLATLTVEGDQFFFSVRKKIFIGMLCCIMVGGIFMSMWLGFTPNTVDYIAGVQGRYVLPFFPLLVLMLKNKVIVLKRNIDKGLGIGLFVLLFLATLDVWSYILI